MSWRIVYKAFLDINPVQEIQIQFTSGNVLFKENDVFTLKRHEDLLN